MASLRDRLPIFGKDPGHDNAQTPAPLDGTLGHTVPEPQPDQMPRPRVGALPLGQSGRANFYGLPQPDEINPDLTGRLGLRRFDEMYRTDAHVRRLVLAAWAPIVAGTWTLEPYGGEDTTDQDKMIADTIWWLLTKFMSPGFTDHLYQVGPVLLRSGFVSCEQVWGTVQYKGKTLLAPRKLFQQLPSSIWRWWQDDFGELTHIGQILPNRADVVIPATDLVYYRLGAEGDNWQGTSLLRHAYKHWYLKDKLERIDAIGQERKAVGMPIVYHTTDVAPQTLDAIEATLANMHMSEAAYMMLPGPKMGSSGSTGIAGTNEFLVDVITFDSSSGEGIFRSIDYHQSAISASFLTDFLELGHHQVGARATAEVQEDPFITAINGALLPPIVPPLNALIDRIRRLNWASAEGSPTLKLTLHDEASLSEVAAYVVPLIQSGAMQVDPELEDYLRDRGGLPAANADVRAQREKAQEAGMLAAQQMATTGETPGEEPPGANADPATQKPNPNPIAGAVKNTGKIPSSGKQLDAPLSGGTATADGLQMVPEIQGDECTCDMRDGRRITSSTCPVHGGKTLDAPAPTAKWFEGLLSQDRLREAFDGARDHIEAACSPQALLMARQLAHQAGNAAPMTSSTPPADLADALTKHYTDMYQLGRDTVSMELAKQRAALGKALDDPGSADAGAAGASRLARARQRGEHSARNILSAVQKQLGRDQITGLKDPVALQTGAEQAATGALRAEALANTAVSINDGRYDGAMFSGDVIGGYVTSVLDERTCDPCATADNGELLSPDEAVAYGPPNPLCQGGDYCRCAIVWVLSSDPAALATVS